VNGASTVTAVAFDFDHTLGVDNGLEIKAYQQLAEQLGAPLGETPAARATIDDILKRFRAAAITLDAAVDEFCAFAGLASSGAPARYREICYGLVDELVTPVDGAPQLIDALHARGIRTAILTNGWSPLQQKKIARALDYAGPVLVSDLLGVLKPAPAAFDRLMETLNVPREQVWFVGDNPTTDVGGARDAGITAIWFDWEGLTYPADVPAPDRRIATLHELLGLLPGPGLRVENST